jgi:hypothetical protein
MSSDLAEEKGRYGNAETKPVAEDDFPEIPLQ